MNRLVLVAVLPILILAAGWRVQRQLRAELIARPPATADDLRWALRLDPDNPSPHFRLGIAHRDLPELQDFETSRGHLETAAALNPYSWRYQRELAQLYELSGLPGDAEQAFLRALELSPRNGAYRWRLASFYLRQRSIDRAVDQLELALAADRKLLEPTLSLLLGAGGSYRQLDRVWPPDPAARRLLLTLLCRRPLTPAGTDFRQQLWADLIAADEAVPLADGLIYIERLVEERRYDQARAGWIELQGSLGLPDRDFETGRNRIWNGHFETRLAQAGFGWTVHAGEGYAAVLAAGEGLDGSQALRVRFDGSRNVDFSGVSQRVPVDPGRSYRLSFHARAENLSTDQGIYFAIRDGPTGRPLAATERLLGTVSWTSYSTALVAAGPWLQIRLRREPSLRFDNRLSGVLWIDSVRLEAVG